MRIGVDARPLSREMTGIPRVVRSVLVELEKLDRKNDYFLYSNKDFSLPFDNPRWHKRVHSSLSFLPGTFWLQTEARRMVYHDGLDLFWATDHILPLSLPRQVRTVLTAHDLVWRLFPETKTWYYMLVHRMFAEKSARKADKVIAVSEATKHDLEDLLKIPAEKIEVAHLGVGSLFRPHEASAAVKYVVEKFAISPRYLCTVGTVQPRKNLATLIEAIGILKKRGQLEHQLVVAGARGWKNSELDRSIQRSGLAEQEVRFLGFVPDDDLPLLYSGAAAFVFPSLYEGFGLPVLEAMACGVPVVASNTSSIPEVAQDAALLVRPECPEEYAEAIRRVWSDAELRSTLILRGLQRAQRFQWTTTAAKILRLFEETAFPMSQARPAER
jgi:glycosyltransferase involved in cell wall biosynthesis